VAIRLIDLAVGLKAFVRNGLALSTCCRIGELLKARWEHIDLVRGTWLIPEENAKNSKTHTVELSGFAKNNFNTLRTLTGTSEWCYPNRKGTQSVCVKTVTKQLGDRQRTNPPMNRRSKATGSLCVPGDM